MNFEQLYIFSPIDLCRFLCILFHAEKFYEILEETHEKRAGLFVLLIIFLLGRLAH